MAVAALQWPDYLILVGFLVISIGIGVYHSVTGGKQKTTAEFIMADRRLRVIPTAISLIVTFQSALSILGFPAEAYCFGIQYMIFSGILSAAVAMLIVCGVLVPLFYPLKLVSINEYLERRFKSRNVRMFAASLGIASGILFNGAVLFATSSALEAGTGLSLKISVPLVVIVAVTYTALGGMRAVIWTDVFQFVIMVGGMSAIFAKGIIAVGGVGEVFRLAEREGRLNWIDVNPDPRVRHTVWGLTFGMTITALHTFGFTQSSVQRYSAVKSLWKAKLTVFINVPVLMLLMSVNSLLGLVVLAYYATVKCDPIANKDVGNVNQLLPFFVFDIFSKFPGFAGLFLATLYGASLSTISTYLSGTAANTWEDILQWRLAKLTESRKAFINRLLIIVIGALSCTVAFFAAVIPGPIIQVALLLISSFGGPITGMFLLGAISKLANSKGALIGGFFGLAFSLWLLIGSLLMNRRPQLLPSVSVEGCSDAVNDSLAFNYNSSTGFETAGSTVESYWHENVTDVSLTQPNTDELHLLRNFYSISYAWFTLLSTLVTTIIGFVVSLITRNKELEASVDDRYLIRFRNVCGSQRDEEQDKEDGSEEKFSPNVELKKYGTPTQIKADRLLIIDEEDIVKDNAEKQSDNI